MSNDGIIILMALIYELRIMNMPTDDEINEVLNHCAEAADEGRSIYPGMTYEQGVEAAIRWMQGDGPNPMED